MIKTSRYIFLLCFFVTFSPIESKASEQSLCLDGFCIGQSIADARFDKADWVIPKKGLTKEKCTGVGCQPDVAFHDYPRDEQAKLAETVSWIYELTPPYNIITKDNLQTLRQYKYECNLSPRGIFGERRFFGAYRSIPSQYLTIVGLRLIDGELKVYRIAREYPFHEQSELTSLAKKLRAEYGEQVLFYDYLSSNAYTDVIQQNKGGWFARSTMFTPNDLSNNAAELVLIDPSTRSLLEPSSMPASGEIKPLPVHPSKHCSRSMPTQ